MQRMVFAVAVVVGLVAAVLALADDQGLLWLVAVVAFAVAVFASPWSPPGSGRQTEGPYGGGDGGL